MFCWLCGSISAVTYTQPFLTTPFRLGVFFLVYRAFLSKYIGIHPMLTLIHNWYKFNFSLSISFSVSPKIFLFSLFIHILVSSLCFTKIFSFLLHITFGIHDSIGLFLFYECIFQLSKISFFPADFLGLLILFLLSLLYSRNLEFFLSILIRLIITSNEELRNRRQKQSINTQTLADILAFREFITHFVLVRLPENV